MIHAVEATRDVIFFVERQKNCQYLFRTRQLGMTRLLWLQLTDLVHHFLAAQIGKKLEPKPGQHEPTPVCAFCCAQAKTKAADAGRQDT
jgi:hypothetical protein